MPAKLVTCECSCVCVKICLEGKICKDCLEGKHEPVDPTERLLAVVEREKK